MREFFASRIMRRLVTFMLLTEFLWGLGNFFVLPTTTLPAYLTTLHASPLVISALSIAIGALPLCPQLFGRSVIQRFTHRKAAVILFHLLCAAPYLILAGTDRVLVPHHPAAQIVLVIVLLAISQMSIGLIMPVWMDMLGQVVPLSLRGRYFGMCALFFAGGGILGGLGVKLLQSLLGGNAYPGIFLVAGAFFMLAMCSFALAPIPAAAFAHPPEPPLLSRIRKSLSALHPRTDFGRLVFSFTAQAVAAGAAPFFIVFALDANGGLGFTQGVLGWMTICQALGSATGGLLLGSLVDRVGPRLPWAASTALIPIVVLLAPHAHTLPLLAVVFLLAGVLVTPWAVTGPAMLELSPPGDKSSYIAMANVVGFLPTVFGALLMGYLIGHGGYHRAFLAAAFFGLLAFAISLTLRRRPAPDPLAAVAEPH